MGQVSRVDSTSVGRGRGFDAPFWVMMRSAAVPGWGQWHNGKWIKAVILGGTEGAFLYGVYHEDRQAAEATDKAHANPDLYDEWANIAADHRAKMRDYLWWGAFTLMLSLGDAYVDAHLQRFDIEFREEDSAVFLSFEVLP